MSFSLTLDALYRMTEQAEQQASMPQEGGPPQALTTDEATPVMPAVNGVAQPSLQPAGSSQDGSPKSAKARPSSSHARRHPPGRPPPLPPYPSSYTNNLAGNADGGTRIGRVGAVSGIVVESPTGGMQVTLDGGGSWSDLARQDATLPTDAAGVANDGNKQDSSSGGVFGFLSRKKGRGNSPKPKERGVLGKEGARQVIG